MSPPAGAHPVRRAWSRLLATGPKRSFDYARHLISERYFEWRFSVRTAGPVRTAAVAQRPGLCKPYAPIAYRSFFAVMRRVDIRPDQDVFLDFGAGRGRAMVLAARWPFRRVVGVEIDPVLAETARENIRRAVPRVRCRDVEVVTADAAEFGCPDDATVLHFFDPFAGAILEQVIASIRTSVQRAPRRLIILFADPNHFAPLATSSDWLVKRAEIPYPFVRGRDLIRESYFIYDAGS